MKSLMLYRIDNHRIKSEFEDPSAVCRKIVPMWNITFIMAAAMSTSVAIFGLILGLTGANPSYAFALIAVGFFLVLIRFPRRGNLVRPLEALYNARLKL
ncbi:MAG: hypothetical protein R3A47_05780 [Polyangiales bacterium]